MEQRDSGVTTQPLPMLTDEARRAINRYLRQWIIGITAFLGIGNLAALAGIALMVTSSINIGIERAVSEAENAAKERVEGNEQIGFTLNATLRKGLESVADIATTQKTIDDAKIQVEEALKAIAVAQEQIDVTKSQADDLAIKTRKQLASLPQLESESKELAKRVESAKQLFQEDELEKNAELVNAVRQFFKTDEKSAAGLVDLNSLIPPDTILAWNNKGIPPEGWVLCDGSNDTPNLVRKFVRGGEGYEVGDEGGDEMVMKELTSSHHLTSFRGRRDLNPGMQTAKESVQSATSSTTVLARGPIPIPQNLGSVPPYRMVQFIMKKR